MKFFVLKYSNGIFYHSNIEDDSSLKDEVNHSRQKETSQHKQSLITR